MPIYKRGDTWWLDFTTPTGERVRRSARTQVRAEALELHDRLRAEAWRIRALGERPKRTWDDAAHRFLLETSHKASHMQDVKTIRWLQDHFRGRALDTITRDEIATVGAIKRTGRSAATANRCLALIRTILRRAALEWEWIDRAPAVRLYPEPKRRVRWITPEQVQSLLRELPEHLRDMTLFSLATGLRQRNVLNLEWSQVDLARGVAWIYADQAKGRRDIHISLNDTALGVLERQRGNHQTRVFTYQGAPVKQVNTKAWRAALVRAEIADFRWHDLRHTWASWLAQRNVPLHVIQEMGGWETAAMVRKYAHLAPAHLSQHAKVVDGLLNGTPATQPDEKGDGDEITA